MFALLLSVESLLPPCSRRCALAAGASVALPAAPALSKRPPPKPVEVTDRSGALVTEAAWLKEAPPEPDLVLGLDGEPYFLLITGGGGGGGGEERSLAPFALRAECTHLGCLVQPEFGDSGGFACPCHGSKYALDGSVRKGPAPRSLGLARVSAREGDGVLMMSPWEDADFRAS
tara:strand:- start:917 stop:1438 length:522 start_codon:yes stop_codon:yes gene_type:complete